MYYRIHTKNSREEREEDDATITIIITTYDLLPHVMLKPLSLSLCDLCRPYCEETSCNNAMVFVGRFISTECTNLSIVCEENYG